MNSCGKKCEVYSRIVGYYRPVDQWNNGKKEEFKDRVEYSESKAHAKEFQNTINIAQAKEEACVHVSDASDVSMYKVFSLPNCSKCASVKEFLAEQQSLQGSYADLAADSGLKELRLIYKDIKGVVKRNDDGSLPIPTVLFYDTSNNIVAAAHNVDQVRAVLGH